jgi:hypothetical protein
MAVIAYHGLEQPDYHIDQNEANGSRVLLQ